MVVYGGQTFVKSEGPSSGFEDRVIRPGMGRLMSSTPFTLPLALFGLPMGHVKESNTNRRVSLLCGVSTTHLPKLRSAGVGT